MRIVFVFFLAVTLMACNAKQQKSKKPLGTLTPEQMVPLLADLHLVDSYDKQHPINIDSARARLENYKATICAAHKTTIAIFDSSFSYYCSHPELLDPIYDEVLNTYSRMQAEEARR